MDGRILPAPEAFRPYPILIPAGFDAHAGDPLGGLRWVEGGFARVTGAIAEIAHRRCGGRIVSLPEGGCLLGALGRSRRPPPPTGATRSLVRVSGHRAREILLRGIALDLHPRTFEAGHAAVRAVAHVGVQIWQRDDGPACHLAIPRSFAASFRSWSREAAPESGYDVVARDA